VARLQRAIGNQAVGRLLRQSGHAGDGVAQRYFTGSSGVRISDGDAFSVHRDSKTMFATDDAIERANAALKSVGALVLLARNGRVGGGGRLGLQPVINPDGVTKKLGRRYARLATRQDPVAQYRTFADCFQTSTTISGLHPGNAPRPGDDPVAVMRLPTLGTVTIKNRREGAKFGAGDAGACASVSFFMAAFPVFKDQIADMEGAEALVRALEGYAKASDSLKFSAGQIVYSSILHSPFKKLFVTTFGINESVAPAIGTALVNVGDAPAATAAKEQGGEKWNMHWAGIVMTDGPDYVTLENFATEFDEVTLADMPANEDFLNVQFSAAGKVEGYGFIRGLWEKGDLINERWVFKVYGKDSSSFHDVAGTDPHATEDTMTLPTSRG
jgi:hypothetical protein